MVSTDLKILVTLDQARVNMKTIWNHHLVIIMIIIFLHFEKVPEAVDTRDSRTSSTWKGNCGSGSHGHYPWLIGRLFGIRTGVPLSNNPFHKGGSRNPNHRAPNHQITTNQPFPEGVTSYKYYKFNHYSMLQGKKSSWTNKSVCSQFITQTKESTHSVIKSRQV